MIQPRNLTECKHTDHPLIANATAPKSLLNHSLASAAIYSIVETAKANGLNVYTYLKFLLERMPNMNWNQNPEVLETLMPWSD